MINENLQQAEKIYFKTGLLSPRAKKIILHITGGDNYTKIIADFYYSQSQQDIHIGNWAISTIGGDDEYEPNYDEHQNTEDDTLSLDSLKELKNVYLEIKSYNKNTFPIKGFFTYSKNDVPFLYSAIKQRGAIITLIKQLPKVAIRNMKEDIRQERDYPELQSYRSDLEHFINHLSLLNNRNQKLKNEILNKMFKSNTTLDELLNFVDEKQNLLGGKKFTRNAIKKIIKEDERYDLELIYDSGNIMVVDVTGPNGIKKIGCNSLWCFTYGSGFDSSYRDWNNYSTNDHVYVIIDFSQDSDSQYFMHVLIKPLDFESDTKDDENDGDTNNHDKLYNMMNEMEEVPLSIIDNLIGLEKAKKLLHFDIAPPVETPKPKPKFVDPNQLSIPFQEPELQQVAELRMRIRKVLLKEIKKY